MRFTSLVAYKVYYDARDSACTGARLHKNHTIAAQILGNPAPFTEASKSDMQADITARNHREIQFESRPFRGNKGVKCKECGFSQAAMRMKLYEVQFTHPDRGFPA
jgi:hypothetical protein